MMPFPYDIAIVGGGIVGLSTAMALSTQAPRLRLLVVEKEPRLGAHQTGHNSGVIHSGIYYRPGSLKASLCVTGAKALIAFCQSHGIPVKQCGKLVIATSQEELPRLEALYVRGQANGVPDLALLGPEEIQEREPHAAGIRALWVPSAGIVDFTQVAKTYAEILRRQGVLIQTNTRLLKSSLTGGTLLLQTSQGQIQSRYLINCAGLHADRVARQSLSPAPLTIVPFRGEYYELLPHRRALVRGLIYPVPDPRFPFLGVHLTRRIDNRVEAGPNALLALKREGYRKTDFSLRDTWEMLTYPGLWRMAARYWRTGLTELLRSVGKQAFVRSVQRLVPKIQAEDLVPAEAGVRAQMLDRAGVLLDDFFLEFTERAIHVCNAPSPAATASLAIGETIAQEATRRFGLTRPL